MFFYTVLKERRKKCFFFFFKYKQNFKYTVIEFSKILTQVAKFSFTLFLKLSNGSAFLPNCFHCNCTVPSTLVFISSFHNSGSPSTPAHPSPAVPGHDGHRVSVCQWLLEEAKGREPWRASLETAWEITEEQSDIHKLTAGLLFSLLH